MRLFIVVLLTPFFLYSQIQIGNDIDGVAAGDNSGIVSLSDDGTIVAIGGPGNDDAGNNTGHVRVFEYSSGDWVQLGHTFYGEAAEDQFGSSISLSGDGTIVAIGAPFNDNGALDGGQVKVFENNAGVWTQLGDAINGVIEEYRFGISLSLSNDGTTLAISGYWCCDWEAIPSEGYTLIYEYTNDDWIQTGGNISTGLRGISDVILSGDGSIVTISTRGGGKWGWSNYYEGGVQVYQNIAGVWTQLGDTFSGEPLPWGVDFIHSVSLTEDGGKIAITSNGVKVYEYLVDTWTLINDTIEDNSYEVPGDVDLSNNGSVITLSGVDNTSFGFVRVYKSESGTWIKKGSDINGEGLGDYVHMVSLSNDTDTIAIGSKGNDDNGVNSGHARVYDLRALMSSDEFILTQFSLYPNPAQHQFKILINSNLELQKVNVYSNLGRLIQSSQEHTIVTSNLASGLYYVEVITNKGKATKKLIIQ